MNVYKYDETTRVLTGATEAREDPRDNGKFLVPSGSTLEKPPSVLTSEEALRLDDSWAKKAKAPETFKNLKTKKELMIIAKGLVRDTFSEKLFYKDKYLLVDSDNMQKLMLSALTSVINSTYVETWEAADGTFIELKAIDFTTIIALLADKQRSDRIREKENLNTLGNMNEEELGQWVLSNGGVL